MPDGKSALPHRRVHYKIPALALCLCTAIHGFPVFAENPAGKGAEVLAETQTAADVSARNVAQAVVQPASPHAGQVGTAPMTLAIMAGGPARIGLDRGGTAQIALAGSQSASLVTLANPLAGARVIYARDTDIVGRPIDIFNPITLGGGIASRAFPSRLPVSSGYLSSRFGLRAHPILGGYRMHSGVDLAAPFGTPIVATANGVVSAAGWRGGYGLSVSVVNGGVETRYGHMSRLNVSAGQNVRQGEVIGYVGSTGRSTGPHVHYEVRMNGQAVDPLRGGASR